MSRFKADFDRRGVSVVVISFAESAKLAPYQRHHRWPFVMLADPERVSYRAFALERLSWFNVFSFSTLRLYIQLLREGKRMERYGRDDYYQAGGDFLVDGSGRILFSHRGKDPADRPPVFKLLEAIDRVNP